MYLKQTKIPILLIILIGVTLAACDSGVDPNASNEDESPSIEFASGGDTAIPTDESTVSITVQINNPPGSEVSAEVLFAEAASSATPSDLGGLTVNSPLSVIFPASAEDGDTETVEVDISEADVTEGAKEARFVLQRVESEAAVEIGGNREFTLSVGFPNLADIRERIGETFTFQAIVTSIRGGDDTSVQDDTGGIVISRNSDFASEVSIGDEVVINGTITDFDGLRQVDQPENLNSFRITSSGNSLPAPLERTIPELDKEEDENMLVRVEGLRFTDERDTFVGGGAEGNFTAEDEEGNSITIRLEDDSFYVGESVPQEEFNFEGVFATFRGSGQLNLQDEGDLIIPEDE